MSFEVRLIINSLAAVLSAFYILLLLSSILKYSDIVRAADPGVFVYPHLLCPGFRFMDIAGKSLSGISYRLSAFLGCDGFTAFCALSFAISVFLPLVSLSLFLLALSDNTVLFLCGLIMSVLISLIPAFNIRQRKKERRKDIDRELPGVISKMVLLTGAGLTVTGAWNIVADSSTGTLYDEMKNTSEKIKNGASVNEALNAFAESLGTKEARQFTGILCGSMSRGGSGMCEALRYLNSESWEGRRQRAKLESQAAASALLLPMIVMFIGIVLMIAIPLLEKINF